MYLDFSIQVKIATRGGTYWYIDAEGTGLDGEPQRMLINGSIGFLRHWIKDRKSLPIQKGKIYHRLQNLGYDVGMFGRDQAERYESYAINGISNLGKNDHREALIEKQERQAERRKSVAENIEY
jgi:hypothetical protein